MYRNCVNFSKTCWRKYSTNLVRCHEEVKTALMECKPVVALESTIITHGMPFPQNVKCAMEVEDIVRSQGAVPATVAIIDGKIRVGLTQAEIEKLGDTERSDPVKTSRRDLSYVLSTKRNGGTTVSGTIIACTLTGIPIFATGGIGGVHRGAETSFDISADLTELGRSNVAVVSSGVKSILDIPKTLEYLETQGVFVASMGPTTDFPAFYSKSSGHHAPYCVNSVTEAAKIIKEHRAVGLKSGLLFAVPVPDQCALDRAIIDDIIKNALEKADRKGIKGKHITPFLLAEIASLTGGNSLETNIALIKNNAMVASQIAVELVKIQQNSQKDSQEVSQSVEKSSSEKRPVIIGGSNLDCVAHLNTEEIKLDGRIHMGRLEYAPGGVGRNICEALGKLGRDCHFISAVGNDEQGRILTRNLSEKSRRCIKICKGNHSAQCIVVLDKNGNCSFLMGDMDIHNQITPEMIELNEEKIKQSPLLIIDGNLSIDSIEKTLEIAHYNAIPVFYEPTDISIAVKPLTTRYWRAIKFITPNFEELKQIYNYLEKNKKGLTYNLENVVNLAKKVASVIDNVIVTLGDQGILVARKGLATEPFLGVKKENNIYVRHYPIEKRTDILNVSGAGDCFASGFITALLENQPEETCMSVGFAAALTALYSQSPVPSKIFTKDHISWMQKAKYVTL